MDNEETITIGSSRAPTKTADYIAQRRAELATTHRTFPNKLPLLMGQVVRSLLVDAIANLREVQGDGDEATQENDQAEIDALILTLVWLEQHTAKK